MLNVSVWQRVQTQTHRLEVFFVTTPSPNRYKEKYIANEMSIAMPKKAVYTDLPFTDLSPEPHSNFLNITADFVTTVAGRFLSAVAA